MTLHNAGEDTYIANIDQEEYESLAADLKVLYGSSMVLHLNCCEHSVLWDSLCTLTGG